MTREPRLKKKSDVVNDNNFPSVTVTYIISCFKHTCHRFFFQELFVVLSFGNYRINSFLEIWKISLEPGAGGVAGIATRYGLEGPGIESR